MLAWTICTHQTCRSDVQLVFGDVCYMLASVVISTCCTKLLNGLDYWICIFFVVLGMAWPWQRVCNQSRDDIKVTKVNI